MSTIRTIACLIIAAACVASFGTAEAAAKPKGVASKGLRVQEELKLKSRATHGKFNNAKMVNPKGRGPKLNPYNGDIGDGTGI